MPTTKCQQCIWRGLSAAILLVGSTLTASAQTPAPSGTTLSDHIARLSIKASQLLPYLQNEVLTHIQEWVHGIAIAVTVLVLLFSFLRLWRENAGGNSNLIFFFLRSLFFFGLVGSSAWIIGQMAATGRQIAEGSEINGSPGRGLLFEFYKAQRDSFNESYEKLVMGTFTVKVDGRDFTVKPSTDTAGTFVGVLYDSEGAIRDLDKKLRDSSYTLPTLFNLLNASRTILEAGDFWLLLLGSVLVLVFKAAAPLMMAVAIDQKLAHKVTYPFAWGAGVLTLIWPAVSYFIRALAYLFGNLAMALGDSETTLQLGLCCHVRDQEQFRFARLRGCDCCFHDDNRGRLFVDLSLSRLPLLHGPGLRRRLGCHVTICGDDYWHRGRGLQRDCRGLDKSVGPKDSGSRFARRTND